MDDKALKVAEARRAALTQAMAEQNNAVNDAMSRLAALRHEAGELDSWIEMWHRLAGTTRQAQAAERSEINLLVVKAQKRKRPKNPDRDVVVQKAVEIIREHGEPMSRKALFDALTEKGVIIQGKDPEMVLSTMLWRSKDRIERLIPFGYWPAGEPYGPAESLKKQLQESFDRSGRSD